VHHSLASLANRMLRLLVQGKCWPYPPLSPSRKATYLLAREPQYRFSNSNPRGTWASTQYISRRKHSYRQSSRVHDLLRLTRHSNRRNSNDHKSKSHSASSADEHSHTNHLHLHLSPRCRLGSQAKPTRQRRSSVAS
jgi:hypothetical protein